jgi:sister chromatid cohesion protein DCC1
MKRKLGSEALLTEQNGVSEIRFASEAPQTRYRIFEVSQSFLSEMTTEGCRLVGDERSDAVLCTSSKTYSIKKVETSNSIYLVPPSSQSRVYSTTTIGTSPYREYYEVLLASKTDDMIH